MASSTLTMTQRAMAPRLPSTDLATGLAKALATSLVLLPGLARAEEVLITFPTVETVSQITRPAVPDSLSLMVDFAVVMRVEDEIGSIVLGNASIADALVTDGGIIVLTGKTVGMTNMIVMDAANGVIAQVTLHVGGRKPGTVTVRRALETESYACRTGLCSSNTGETAQAEPEALPSPL